MCLKSEQRIQNKFLSYKDYGIVIWIGIGRTCLVNWWNEDKLTVDGGMYFLMGCDVTLMEDIVESVMSSSISISFYTKNIKTKNT